MKRIILLTLLISSNFLISQNTEKNLSIKSKAFGQCYLINQKEITKTEFEQTIKSNSESFDLYKKGKKQQTISNIIGIPSGLVFGWNLGTWLGSGEKPNMTVLTTSGVIWGSSMVMYYMGQSKINNALDIYNSKENEVSIKFNLNSYGIGIAANF